MNDPDKHLDLEKTEYRDEGGSIPYQPVFQKGGFTRLCIWIGFMLFAATVAALLKPPIDMLFNWFWPVS